MKMIQAIFSVVLFATSALGARHTSDTAEDIRCEARTVRYIRLDSVNMLASASRFLRCLVLSYSLH